MATLIELIRNAPKNIDLLAAFTVQEEVGLRGAKVAAYSFDPDLAIVLDCTIANDLPAWDNSENTQYNTHLDAGPAIYVADSGTLSDPRLVRHFVDTAELNKIPYQIRQPGGGRTDASEFTNNGRAFQAFPSRRPVATFTPQSPSPAFPIGRIPSPSSLLL